MNKNVGRYELTMGSLNIIKGLWGSLFEIIENIFHSLYDTCKTGF